MNFHSKLTDLIIKHRLEQQINGVLPPRVIAETVEGLTACLATFISIECGSRPELVSQLLDGATGYLYEVAAEKRAFGEIAAKMAGQK